MLSSLFALLPLLPLLTALELAGNENYARTSRRLLRRSIERRSSYIPAFQPESVSFTIGSKEYLSPTGNEFKAYTFDNDFGLEGYGGDSMLVTVLPVQGNVTCDALGKKVAEYMKKDDVWDKVSPPGLGGPIKADWTGLHAGCRLHLRQCLPCRWRSRGMYQRLGREVDHKDRRCYIFGLGYRLSPRQRRYGELQAVLYLAVAHR